MKEKKFTLKAKRNKDEEYIAYYPKTSWDNVLADDGKCINNYIKDNFYNKNEADTNFITKNEAGNFYTKEEIDTKVSDINGDISDIANNNVKNLISNNYYEVSEEKAPSLTLFRKISDRNYDRWYETNNKVLEVEAMTKNVCVNYNGDVGSFKFIIFDKELSLPVNTTDDVSSQKTVVFPHDVTLTSLIYSDIQTKSDDYICKINQINLSEGKVYLSVEKLNDNFLEDTSINVKIIMIGK